MLRFQLLKVTATFIIPERNHECAVNMGIKSFLAQCARTLKLAVKPGREELWLSIKISLLGIGVVGLVGYVIKLIAWALT
jgi:protein translocase SEC61 complex gamma subunit